MRALLRLAIPIVFLLVGYGLMVSLKASKKEPAVRRPPHEVPIAEVVEIRRQDFSVTLTAQGVVHARNATSLTPRVSGRVVAIKEDFEAGAFFKKGEILLQLDATDFEADLASAEAQVARSEAALAQEKARSLQALLDWTDLGYTDPPSDLVLRKPQLKEAEANVKAAEAQQLQAERDLERTDVLAPYDGCVRTRLVGLGQSVNSGTSLGDIFSTDFAEIRLPLSAEDLPFINLPEENGSQSISAILTDALKPVDGLSWTAEVIRSEGVLDETSRELFLTARVADPYGLKSDHPPLRIGQPVLAKVTGKVLKGVYVLPRSSLRSPTEVILVDPETSTIQRTTIAPIWSDKTQLVVRDELPEGHLLVVSRLTIAANGTKVKTIPYDEAPKAALSPEESDPDA